MNAPPGGDGTAIIPFGKDPLVNLGPTFIGTLDLAGFIRIESDLFVTTSTLAAGAGIYLYGINDGTIGSASLSARTISFSGGGGLYSYAVTGHSNYCNPTLYETTGAVVDVTGGTLQLESGGLIDGGVLDDGTYQDGLEGTGVDYLVSGTFSFDLFSESLGSENLGLEVGGATLDIAANSVLNWNGLSEWGKGDSTSGVTGAGTLVTSQEITLDQTTFLDRAFAITDDVTYTNDGTMSAYGGIVLNADGASNSNTIINNGVIKFYANYSGVADISESGTSSLVNNGTIETVSSIGTGTATVSTPIVSNNATLRADGGTLVIAAACSGTGKVIVSSSSTLDIEDNTSVQGVFTNSGVVNIINTFASTTTLTFLGTITNNGNLDVGTSGGGALDISANIAGTGTIGIYTSNNVTLGGYDAGQTVSWYGGAGSSFELELTSPGSFSGTLSSDFISIDGSSIYLPDTAGTSLAYVDGTGGSTTGTLEVLGASSRPGTSSELCHFTFSNGNTLSVSSFGIQSDGAGCLITHE
jgi:hypothetical protein